MFYESWSTFCRICVEKIKSTEGLYLKLKASSYLFLIKTWRKPSYVMLNLSRRKQRKLGPNSIWKSTTVGVHNEDTWTSWLSWNAALSPLPHSFSLSGSQGDLCVNTQSIFPSRKHDSYSESCPREMMSPLIKPVWWYDAWQTSPNFADLFLFLLEAVYALSQPVEPRACLSVCVPLVHALFKQGSAFPQRHFAVKITL